MKKILYKTNEIEKSDLLRQYFMYEFSDDIVVVSDDNIPYPSIFNFVKTGVLSEEEVSRALLRTEDYNG